MSPPDVLYAMKNTSSQLVSYCLLISVFHPGCELESFFTHRETVILFTFSQSPKGISTKSSMPSKFRAWPILPVAHDGPFWSIPTLPLPEESAAEVPDTSSSFHQPTRPLVISACAGRTNPTIRKIKTIANIKYFFTPLEN